MGALARLTLCAAIGPLAINMTLPMTEDIARDLDTSYAQVQAALSLYLVLTAALQVALGPLSDRVGRRPVMVTGLLTFVVGTLLSAGAMSLDIYLLGRALQAGAAAGMVISRASARDSVPAERSAAVIGHISSGIAFAPMVALPVGGILGEMFGWRVSLLILAAMGGVALTVAVVWLRETNTWRSTDGTDAQQISRWQPLRSSSFWAHVGAATFSSAIFFALVGGTPLMATVVFGLTPSSYAILFTALPLGFAMGANLGGVVSTRTGTGRAATLGTLTSLAGCLILAGAIALGASAAGLTLALFVTGVGNGITGPSATAGAARFHPRTAGLSVGITGGLQTGTGAVGVAVASYAIGDGTATVQLIVILTVLAFLAVSCAVAAARLP